jgi:hypothetical protein
MDKFPKTISKVVSIFAAFMLGAYVTQEYKFNQPIEFYRYLLTFFFGIMFYVHGHKKD